MSETMIAVDTPAPDAALEVAAPPAPTAADIVNGLDSGDAFSTNAAGRVIDAETKRYVSADGSTSPTTDAADEAAPGAGEQDTDATKGEGEAGEGDAADTASSEPVRIAVPAMLQHRFGAEMTFPADTDANALELLRWSVNNPVRASEVQEQRRAADHFYAAFIEEAEVNKALRQQIAAFSTDPAIRAEQEAIEELRVLHGDYVADMAARDLAARIAAPADEARAAAAQMVQEQMGEQQAQAFVTSAMQQTGERYEHWTLAERNASLAAFGTRWDAMGMEGVPTLQQYVDFADALYVTNPRFLAEQDALAATERARLEQEAIARGRQQAAEEQRKQMEAAALARRGNPLGGLPRTVSGDVRVDSAPQKVNVREHLESLGL